ncbi:MAG: porin [bacterium]|nr:porin [bacterium]
MSVLTRFGLAAVLAGTSLVASAENLTPNLKFNGFASATGAVVDNAHGGEYIRDPFGYPGLTEDASFGLESVIGLQFDYRVNDKTNVVTQIVAEGRNSYQAEAEWAYIAYQLNDSLSLRGGRLALPIYMYSDSIRVAQSYPWARLPVEVYAGVPVTNFNGMDLLYRKPLGDWNLNAQLLVGGSTTPLFRTQNARGLNLSLSNDSLTLRAGYIADDLTFDSATLPPPLVLDGVRTSFSNVGALYDDGNWFAAGEFSQLRIRGWLEDWDAGYASVGHYVGKWLPFVLWSKVNGINAQDCVAVAPYCLVPVTYQEQTTYALGAKYALSSNVSMKAQVDHVTGFNGTNGFLSFPKDTPATLPHNPGSFNVITLSLTTAF